MISIPMFVEQLLTFADLKQMDTVSSTVSEIYIYAKENRKRERERIQLDISMVVALNPYVCWHISWENPWLFINTIINSKNHPLGASELLTHHNHDT